MHAVEHLFLILTSIKSANRHNALLRTPMAYNDERYTNYGLVFHEAGYLECGREAEVQVSETR